MRRSNNSKNKGYDNFVKRRSSAFKDSKSRNGWTGRWPSARQNKFASGCCSKNKSKRLAKSKGLSTYSVNRRNGEKG